MKNIQKKIEKKNVFHAEKNHQKRWILLVVLHAIGAFFLSVFLYWILAYVGFLGELISGSLFVAWQKLGKNLLPHGILILSICVIFLSNPIYALICLILIFFSTAAFLISLKINFLGMIYLIIYIGAIAILFLFVIMMFNLRQLNQKVTSINDRNSLIILWGCYFLSLSKFFSLVSNSIWRYIEYDQYINDLVQKKFENLKYFLTYQHTDTLLFGTLLYDYYSYLFILAALVLLTSMLGSIILALSTTEKVMTSRELKKE